MFSVLKFSEGSSEIVTWGATWMTVSVKSAGAVEPPSLSVTYTLSG